MWGVVLRLVLSLVLDVRAVVVVSFTVILGNVRFGLDLCNVSLLSRFVLLTFYSSAPGVLLFALTTALFLVP